MGRRAELVQVLQFIGDGRLEPVVDSVLPLAEARRAHERIEARSRIRKVVLSREARRQGSSAAADPRLPAAPAQERPVVAAHANPERESQHRRGDHRRS